MFPCPRLRLRIWFRETVSAVASRVSLLISILRLNLVLTYGIPPEFRGGGVHLFVVESDPSIYAESKTYILYTYTYTIFKEKSERIQTF